jgi:hypothetical protein
VRRRERIVEAVCDGLEALDLVISQAEDLQRELSLVWDLTVKGPDLVEATAAKVAALTAQACLGASHRLKLADRIRASRVFEERPPDKGR